MLEAQNVSERILELRQVPMLRALPTRTLAELAREIAVEVRREGAELVTEGRAPRALGWMVEGRARWTREGRAIGDAELGASLGLLELLARADAVATATSTTSTTMFWLPADRLFELLEDSFDLVHAMLGAIANDLALGGCRHLGRTASLVPAPRALPNAELDFTERLVRLRMSRPFVRAPIRSLAVLAQRATVRRWPRGGVLWEGGRAARDIVTIVSGKVREGRATLGARDTAGLVAALAGRRRDTFCVARAPTTGIVLDIEALTDVLEDDDELALELLRGAADELLVLGMARGLPPDVYGGAPDRSLTRVLRASTSPGETYG